MLRTLGLGIALGLGLSAALGCQGPPPAPPELSGEAVEIVPPAAPLPVTAWVRPGSFRRSRVSPSGAQVRFADVLRESKIFARVVEEAPEPGAPVLELELAGADYGEPRAYTLELQVAVLRERRLVESYFAKYSFQQPEGVRSQLTVGPAELGQLAERAIRDLCAQLAANADQLTREP